MGRCVGAVVCDDAFQSGSGKSMIEGSIPSFVIFCFNCSTPIPIFFNLKYFLYSSLIVGVFGVGAETGSEDDDAFQSGSGKSMIEGSIPSFVIFCFSCSTPIPIFFSLKYFLYSSLIAGFAGALATGLGLLCGGSADVVGG